MIGRGWVWQTKLDKQRPALIVMDEALCDAPIWQVTVVPVTSTMDQALFPCNLVVEKGQGGLAKDSVADVLSTLTIPRANLVTAMGKVDKAVMDQVDEKLKLLLGL